MNKAIIFTFALAGWTGVSTVSCGGAKNGGDTTPKGAEPADEKPTAEEAEAATHPCGQEKTHVYDLHDPDGDSVATPCSSSGKHDYSGLVKLETVEGGVHITIDARDDEVTILGPDVKSRDAVIVYPSHDKKTAIEVPLLKTKTGYHGDKIVFWDQLDKLTDEGTKFDVAVFDHDKKTGSHEEMHVSVSISAGKSCERARDENPDTLDMGKGGGGGKDLTNDQLGAPMKDGTIVTKCGLPDAAKAHICVAVKNGKPLGVSVGTEPENKKIAACIDKAARRLSFPTSPKLDVVKQDF